MLWVVDVAVAFVVTIYGAACLLRRKKEPMAMQLWSDEDTHELRAAVNKLQQDWDHRAPHMSDVNQAAGDARLQLLHAASSLLTEPAPEQ